MEIEFQEFPKLARLSRDIFITEKLDGTNAQIYIGPDGDIKAGSRNRWITVDDDNYGFARYVENNKDELLQLGEGRHYGEWWGSGIQRGYGLTGGQKFFSLFNAGRWVPKGHPLGDKQEHAPDCCKVVPILYVGVFDTDAIDHVLYKLGKNGSSAAPGFMNPEGIIIYHTASRVSFKKTIKDDALHKSQILKTP